MVLRVAFFGSETFSINCLKAILGLRNGPISHLDIVTKSPKPSGRGLKTLKDVPISQFAEQNGLSLLRADTNTDILKLQQQNNYNLCIAVSYGKLIPSSFLDTLQFGGLNVHPSLLPQYSGPAPLSRALLNFDETTGVAVQTLHPTEFDKGDVLALQEYTIEKNETYNSLADVLSLKGGQLLHDVLKGQLYDPQNPHYQIIKPTRPHSYAPKIKPSESQILWNKYTSFQILRRFNTLNNKLYTFKEAYRKKKHSTKRVIITKLSIPTNKADITAQQADQKPGTFFLNSGNQLQVKTVDGFVTVEEIKSEGFGSESGKQFFDTLTKKFGPNTSHVFLDA